MEAIVKLQNIDMKYHTQNDEIIALENINLEIFKGEFIGIVGPSGCGKSTLLSIISGLIKPTNGAVYINSRVKTNPSSNVGYMLQKDYLFDWRTILQNIMLGLEISNKSTPSAKEYVMNLLKTYDLFEFRNNYPNELSGGMRQRVALIRTLATTPDILLLDEAFSALDYQTRLLVTDDIFSIIKNENKTSILVTHDIAEAISMCDRIVILSRRPGTIKKIINIKLSCQNRTPLSSREAPEFREYFNQIWKELDIHV